MRVRAVNAAATAALVALVAACGGGAGKPPPTTPAPAPAGPATDPALARDIADGFLEILTTMAAITEAAPDCPAMAVQLTELFDQSAELFDLARAQGADPEAGPLLEAELDRRASAVAPLVERIQAGLGRCQLDRDVAAAMERMPTL